MPRDFVIFLCLMAFRFSGNNQYIPAHHQGVMLGVYAFELICHFLSRVQFYEKDLTLSHASETHSHV